MRTKFSCPPFAMYYIVANKNACKLLAKNPDAVDVEDAEQDTTTTKTTEESRAKSMPMQREKHAGPFAFGQQDHFRRICVSVCKILSQVRKICNNRIREQSYDPTKATISDFKNIFKKNRN